MSCAISDCHALCIYNRTDDTGKLALCHIPIWDEFLSCPNACTIAYNSDSWNVGQSCLLAFDDVFCAISKTPYYDRRSAFFAPLVLDSDKIYCLDDKYLKIISENRINEMEIIKQTKKMINFKVHGGFYVCPHVRFRALGYSHWENDETLWGKNMVLWLHLLLLC